MEAKPVRRFPHERQELRRRIRAELDAHPDDSFKSIARRLRCSATTVGRVAHGLVAVKPPESEPASTQKVCTRCRLQLPLDAFDGDGRSAGVAGRVRSQCRTCYSTYHREYRLRWKYGLGVDDVDRLMAAQSGACGICRVPIDQAPGAAHIDHDHAHRDGDPAAVRGLLCSNCNRGLGCFRDDPAHLAAAIEYLRHPPAAALAPRELLERS